MEQKIQKINYNVSKRKVLHCGQKSFTNGYVQKATTIEELHDDICAGKSIWPVKTYPYEGFNRRETEHVLSANILIMNICGDYPYEEACQRFHESAIAVYETNENTKIRVRVIFSFGEDLKRTEYEYLLNIISLEYGHHSNCQDPAHAYINSKIINWKSLNTQNRMPISELFSKYIFKEQFNSKFINKWEPDDSFSSFLSFQKNIIKRYNIPLQPDKQSVFDSKFIDIMEPENQEFPVYLGRAN